MTLQNVVVRSDHDGKFQISGDGDAIGLRAYGYARQSIAVGDRSAPIVLIPMMPKALYLWFYGIGSSKFREAALGLIDKTELNAVVIDLSSISRRFQNRRDALNGRFAANARGNQVRRGSQTGRRAMATGAGEVPHPPRSLPALLVVGKPCAETSCCRLQVGEGFPACRDETTWPSNGPRPIGSTGRPELDGSSTLSLNKMRVIGSFRSRSIARPTRRPWVATTVASAVAPAAITALSAASTVAPVMIISSTMRGFRPRTSPIRFCAITSAPLTRTLATIASGRFSVRA